VAIAIAPRRRRIGLSGRTDPARCIDTAGVAAFLRELLRHLQGKVIVVWDGGSNHQGPPIRERLAPYPRLHLQRLPGYAPDLNPVEMIWAYLRHGLLANFVPRHVRQLDRVVGEHLGELAGKPALIQSLWRGSKLPFVDKNLTT
jgi:hypothetical protein